jgi:hypothetical protein
VSLSSEQGHRAGSSLEETSSFDEESEESSSPLACRYGHIFLLVDILALFLVGRHWTTLSNGIFSVTSVNISVYMESPPTISMRHTRLFSEEVRRLNFQ